MYINLINIDLNGFLMRVKCDARDLNLVTMAHIASVGAHRGSTVLFKDQSRFSKGVIKIHHPVVICVPASGAPRCSLREQVNVADPTSRKSVYVTNCDTTFRIDKQVNIRVRTKLGVSEEMVRRISERNGEPEWMLEFRLDAFRQWLAMDVPCGARCPPVDVRAMCAEAVPARTLLDLDGESFAVTHKETLGEAGVIYCTITEAIRWHPELVRRHLGRVVPPSDNFYAALNSAVFLDGSFCYVPAGVTCPMDISTHFLVDGRKTSSPFERTLIICDEGASVSSLGCTSPPPAGMTQQLNVPVIELFCAAGAEIKHVTVQNWLEAGASADSDAQEELLCNYVTQRGLCDGARSKITWTVVEAGSGATWQHPAVVLKGDESVGECFSVTLTNAHQHADVGAAMVHSGRQTRSRVVGKTISAGASRSSSRTVIHVEPWSSDAKSNVEWDFILIGDHAESTSCPSVVARNTTSEIEEKGSTSKVSKEQVFYFQQRGIAAAKAIPAILTGFCDEVLRELPHEFESEVREMVAMKIEEFVDGSL